MSPWHPVEHSTFSCPVTAVYVSDDFEKRGGLVYNTPLFSASLNVDIVAKHSDDEWGDETCIDQNPLHIDKWVWYTKGFESNI